MFINT